MRLLLLAAFLVASGAAAQTPDGLVGTWRFADPRGVAGGDMRFTGMTFRADGSLGVAYTPLTAYPYRITEPLRGDAGNLVGRIVAERDGRTLTYDVTLEPGGLLMARGGDRLGDVADFNRISGPPGGLVGTWAAASYSGEGGTERTMAGDRLESFTFTADSLVMAFSLEMHYQISDGEIQMFDGRVSQPGDGGKPFRLDGDALTLSFDDPQFATRLVRVPAEVPATQDPTPLLGTWTPIIVDEAFGGVAEATDVLTLYPDGRYVRALTLSAPFVARGEIISLGAGGEAICGYGIDGQRLHLDCVTIAVVAERESGEGLTGRWRVLQSTPDLADDGGPGIRTVTFTPEGVATVEGVSDWTWRLVDGRLAVMSAVGEARFRYGLSGDVLTLTSPADEEPPLFLRRAP